MKQLTPENLLFVIFVITILVTRAGLYVGGLYTDDSDSMGITIKDFRIHHYMYGAVLAPIGLIVASIPVFAVGLGLFVDELTYLIGGGKNHKDNYSWWSLTGTLVLIGTIFLLRKYLVMPFGK